MSLAKHIKNWAIKNKVKACLLLVLASFAVFLFYKSLLPKPWEADFDPQDFRISQFFGAPNFTQFAQTHLPVGTPRAFVDSVLVAAGGTTATEYILDADRVILSSPVDKQVAHLKPKTMVRYEKPSWYAYYLLSAGWRVFAFYDENGKLLQLSTGERVLLE